MSIRAVIFTAIIIVAIHVLLLFLALSPASPEATIAGMVSEDIFSLESKTDARQSKEPLPELQDLSSRPASKTQIPDVQQPSTEPISVPAKPIPMKQPAKTVPAKTVPAKQPVQTAKASAPAEESPAPIKNFPSTVKNVMPIVHKPFRPLDYSKAKTGNLNRELTLKNPTLKKATGILVDLDSRKVLWQKEPDREVAIASLSKMMTLLIACETVSDPSSSFRLDTPVSITPESRNVPPSGVAFQKDEASFPLELLMIAAAVKSANDAAYLIAQTLGNGKVDNFVVMMNDRAKELGMNHTHFFNPHGLNGKTAKLDNKSTANDLVRLSEACLDCPMLHQWSAMRFASFRIPNDLRNHNNLLPGARTACAGTTGLKTGFTQRAGFCVSAVCERKGRHLLAVVTGFSTARERDQFVRALFDWGFQH